MFHLSFASPGERACLCPCPLCHSILQQTCFSLGAARQAHGLAFIFLPGNFGSVSCCHLLGIPCGWWHSPWPLRWAGSLEPPQGAQSCRAHLPRLTCTLKCHTGTAARGARPGWGTQPGQGTRPGWGTWPGWALPFCFPHGEPHHSQLCLALVPRLSPATCQQPPNDGEGPAGCYPLPKSLIWVLRDAGTWHPAAGWWWVPISRPPGQRAGVGGRKG